MKNVMVANYNKKSKTKFENLKTLLAAQIENSLELEWSPKDICIVANFKFEHKKIKTMVSDLNEHCFTGSKMFGLKWIMDKIDDEVYWAHDLDCWQCFKFECPKFNDVGICEYSRPTLNGGSVFWRNSAKDIVSMVMETIVKEMSPKEEPILNKILKSKEYKKRVTVINSTYNVGCSGFAKRYERAIKPIRVSHFHPTNRIAWETHALDRNCLGYKSVSDRLEKLIRKFFPNIATELCMQDPRNRLNHPERIQS
jgi:hypothetical protein